MGRAPCCDKAKVKRGPWSPEEDTVLKSYVERYGTGGNWIALPHKAGLKRCGKSCRLRWLNYLRPDIRHGDFTEEEDNIICGLYRNIGSRWSVIASHLQGRTDNDVKNYWNTKLKRKVLLSNGQNNLTSITTPSPVEVESFGQDRVSAFVNQPASTNFAGNSIGYVVSPPAQDISAASSSLTMENSHNYLSWPESTGTSGWAGVAGDNGSTINTSFDINPPLPPPPPPDFFNWFNVQDGFFGEDKTTYYDSSLSNLSNLWASIESNYQMDCTNFSNTHT